jgi:mRNA-degrading endonuclease RelE of RelBE toxin-antitoxin system
VARKKPDRAPDPGTNGRAQLYHFVEVASFTEDWADLRLGDEELWALEDEIARNPTRAPVVPGGCGARKIRRPNPTSGKGKSGGYRVLYAFLPAHGTVLLLAAWSKSECEDLEPDDYKVIGKVVARIQKRLDEGGLG